MTPHQAAPRPRATPLARRLAQSRGVAFETLSPSVAGGKVQAADVLDALETQSAPSNSQQGKIEQAKIEQRTKQKLEQRLFASPRARVRATAAGVDLQALQGRGSGPQGRIVQQDIEQALQRGGSGGQAGSDLPVNTPFDLRPHTTMREVIARRLTLSKSTIPHFTLTSVCRIDALLSLREQINHHFFERHRHAGLSEQEKPFKISVNDLLVKALALSLELCPDANVAWSDEGMKHFQRVDVAVAVAVPGGLVTPIVRDAATKNFATLARELHALIARARQGKLQYEDYMGGTISISNLGMFGTHAFQAIINPPQAAILAIGAGEKVLTKNASNVLVEETRLCATLSADHRAIDGAVAARLCDQFKQIVEQPVLLLLDKRT